MAPVASRSRVSKAFPRSEPGSQRFNRPDRARAGIHVRRTVTARTPAAGPPQSGRETPGRQRRGGRRWAERQAGQAAAPGRNAEPLHDGEAIERAMQHFQKSANAASQSSHEPPAPIESRRRSARAGRQPDATSPAKSAESAAVRSDGSGATGAQPSRRHKSGRDKVKTAIRTMVPVEQALGPSPAPQRGRFGGHKNPDTGPLEKQSGVGRRRKCRQRRVE